VRTLRRFQPFLFLFRFLAAAAAADLRVGFFGLYHYYYYYYFYYYFRRVSRRTQYRRRIWDNTVLLQLLLLLPPPPRTSLDSILLKRPEPNHRENHFLGGSDRYKLSHTGYYNNIIMRKYLFKPRAEENNNLWRPMI